MVENEERQEAPKGEDKGLIPRAEELMAKLEKKEQEVKALVEENKRLEAERILSGKADAGQTRAEEPEETPKEYAEKVLNGEVKAQ